MPKAKPAELKQNQRETYATAFAELLLIDHLRISQKHFDLLLEVFSEKEVLELTACCTFISASQRLGAVLNLTAAV